MVRLVPWRGWRTTVLALAAAAASAAAGAGQRVPDARALGVPLTGAPGPHNAITDVAGVEVGHVTLIRGEGTLVVGEGPVRTGVTAILPRGRAAGDSAFAAWFSLNGNGEMTGTTWIDQSGILESPVLITNTHSVGVVRDAVIEWMRRRDPDFLWALPVVAETYDGSLNDINGFHVRPEHVFEALDGARGGAVGQGAVGGGTGMRCHGFKGGIGSASRVAGGHTVGVLVQCNQGRRADLRIAGTPAGELLPEPVACYADRSVPASARRRGVPWCDGGDDAGGALAALPEGAGSIIIVLATDAPLLPTQLERLATRTALGLARVGGMGYNGSGDIFLAFSTANRRAAAERRRPTTLEMLPNDRAVRAAAGAFPGWRDTPAVERARVLFRLHALLNEHKEELAVSLTREHGKVVAETRGEIQRGIENVEHACGIPTLLMGDTVEGIAPGIDCASWRQPLGVFGIITPYNFPVMIPLWFWPYAVATGNTVVLKPSEQDPLTHQKIVELAAEAGVPAGVLNVVHGGRETVEAVCDHPDIVGVSFVGSSRVAEIVYRRAAAAGKRVQALGGAKNHIVVLPDADLDVAVDACLGSVFGSSGQRCLAGSVFTGVGDVYGEFRERMLDGARALRLGDGLDPDTDMGPVISAGHRDRVNAFIDGGAAGQGTLVLDGRGATVAGLEGGYWVGPTVFEDVDLSTPLGTEEIFGPVAGLSRVDSADEAVAQMRASRYGNACSIFTTSGGAAREFRRRAGISMIGVNIGVAAPMAFFPFGGSKGSFYGDLKAQGRDAISFYTDQRVVISRW